MSKHTPGPWHRHGLHVHASYGEPLKHYAVVDALQHGGMVEGEAEANARLIAAAPELLEVCKKFEAIVDSWLPAIVKAEHADEWKALHAVRQYMLDAVAKAEGGDKGG